MMDAFRWVAEAALEQARARQGSCRRLIDELTTEEKREVLRMIHEEEMEIREVAGALGIPEGTVKSRLHHARKRLARAWETSEMRRGMATVP